MRTSWNDQAREERLLFNPGFLALLLARSAQGYASERAAPLPIPLSFVTCGLALYRPVRELLPRTVRTNLLRWTQDHPDVRALTALRLESLVPAVREGLLYATGNGACSVAPEGGLHLDVELSAPSGDTADVIESQRAAIFTGRWVARSGSPSTILALFGVRP